MEQTDRKIALLHHIGSGNLGDDATVDAVMQNIRRRWPRTEICALSMNPEDTEKRHGVASYAVRLKTWRFGYEPPAQEANLKNALKARLDKHAFVFRLVRAANTIAIRLPRTICRELSFLVASYRLVKTLDLLVVCGGGQLTEWGGPWEFPYTVFKWITLARFAGVGSIFLNVGAGPLTYPLSKLFARRALRAARYVSFRDQQSLALARQIGFARNSQVFPDSVYGLDLASQTLSSKLKGDQSIVGISPMPYCDPRVYPDEKNQAAYEDFISKFAHFSFWLIGNSYSLRFFGSDIGVDPLAIADLQTALRNHFSAPESPYDPVNSVDELLAAMSAMDYVVTCRFHGVVLAHLLNKPVLAVSHHPKVENLMKDLGLADYCVDIRTCEPTLLADKFSSLVCDADAIKRQMASRLEVYGSQSKSQFDQLFPMRKQEPQMRRLFSNDARNRTSLQVVQKATRTGG